MLLATSEPPHMRMYRMYSCHPMTVSKCGNITLFKPLLSALSTCKVIDYSRSFAIFGLEETEETVCSFATVRPLIDNVTREVQQLEILGFQQVISRKLSAMMCYVFSSHVPIHFCHSQLVSSMKLIVETESNIQREVTMNMS